MFRTLLSGMQHLPTPPPVEVLLLQGVDSRRPDGNHALQAFSTLRAVSLHEVPMGQLGRDGVGAARRAMKVVDVARLRRGRHRRYEVAEAFAPHLLYSSQQRWDQRLAADLARRLDRPRVVHLHYTVGPWLGDHAVNALREADLVLSVSDFIRDNAVTGGVRADRARTLHNAVQDSADPSEQERLGARARFRSELSLPDDALIVGMVARLSVSKCQVELLQAMVPLMRQSAATHLVLAGQEYPRGNGLATRLAEAAADAGVSRQVHLLGQRGDVPALLDALDVFAHPTRQEPCALSVLEAMAHSLPVVAWREGGTAELVDDTCTGVLVPPMDVNGLSGALGGLLADPALREALGRAGRARAREMFRPPEASERFLELLEGVAGRVSKR